MSLSQAVWLVLIALFLGPRKATFSYLKLSNAGWSWPNIGLLSGCLGGRNCPTHMAERGGARALIPEYRELCFHEKERKKQDN